MAASLGCAPAARWRAAGRLPAFIHARAVGAGPAVPVVLTRP